MISSLITKFKQLNISEEDKDKLVSCLNSYVDYFNQVVKMNIRFSSTLTWTPTTEYMYKSMDEERRFLHDLCIQNTKEINDLCDKYFIDHFCTCNLNDRYEVANFIGNVLSDTYSSEINRSSKFDNMVQEYTDKNKFMDYRTNDDWEI